MEAFMMYQMDTVTRVQILDEVICISYCADTLGIGMNSAILSPTQRLENSRVDCTLYPFYGNQSRRMKTLNLNQLKSASKILLSYSLTINGRLIYISWVTQVMMYHVERPEMTNDQGKNILEAPVVQWLYILTASL